MTLLSDLVTRARQRADLVNNQVVTDPEWATYLNDELAEYYDTLVGEYEDYNIATADLAITSATDGQNFFSLPVDFLKSRAVHRQYGSGWIPLDPFSLQDAGAFSLQSLPLAPGCPSVRYRIEGQKVVVLPVPSAPGTYRLYYIPKYTALALSDALPPYMDQQAWFRAAVAGACAQAMQKQELDPSAFAGEKQAQLVRIVAAAKSRDAGAPKKIANTRRSRGWRGGRGGGVSW